jgi:hypothetical protein
VEKAPFAGQASKVFPQALFIVLSAFEAGISLICRPQAQDASRDLPVILLTSYLSRLALAHLGSGRDPSLGRSGQIVHSCALRTPYLFGQIKCHFLSFSTPYYRAPSYCIALLLRMFNAAVKVVTLPGQLSRQDATAFNRRSQRRYDIASSWGGAYEIHTKKQRC